MKIIFIMFLVPFFFLGCYDSVCGQGEWIPQGNGEFFECNDDNCEHRACIIKRWNNGEEN